ncbi:RNA polymerase sigma factor [Phytomonospora endophytica]|uniref:RNA polymerase sigma-70 factor (ECF subfamily) n=1 Tax=Phytomonospora endophytica TaxID=714109 RepID=A0A841FZP1_9ACTN|nr:sigma-70 family RNA polymerase sigma factor [Phytomonospora endophytica]MBB6038992.1 RNA polymerase sigma-70 factor (ECF subfamily) [Phytomonospora endophytica]GIG67904.1 DNA-directed RNA polymerase sigma-70 factor [Phytomonospora endophytica]
MTTIHADIPGLVARGSPRPREATDTDDAEHVLGDADRFTVLFDRHAAALHRYAARRVGPDLADDLVSQTFLTAFANRHRYDPRRPSALPWLYGICTNLMRRHRRTEARAYKALAKTGVDPLRTADATDRSLDRVEAQGMSRRLADALASLKANQRDVLLLFAVAELTYPEIAAALRIPEGTVRSRLSRARTHLRKRLGTTP